MSDITMRRSHIALARRVGCVRAAWEIAHADWSNQTDSMRIGSAMHKLVLLDDRSEIDELIIPHGVERRERGATYLPRSVSNDVLSLASLAGVIRAEIESAGPMLGAERKINFDLGGIAFASTLDAFGRDYIADLKITSDASPAAFRSHSRAYGYDLQAALYSHAFACEFGALPRVWRTICVELAPPHHMAVYEFVPDACVIGPLISYAERMAGELLREIARPASSRDVPPTSYFDFFSDF